MRAIFLRNMILAFVRRFPIHAAGERAVEDDRSRLGTNIHAASFEPALARPHHQRRVLFLRVGQEKIDGTNVDAQIATRANFGKDGYGIDDSLIRNYVDFAHPRFSLDVLDM